MSTELSAATVARAADLARHGEYDDAVAILVELGGRESDDPRVLDLLARIHAQRGELYDADECWALALRIDGDLTQARAGRQRIAAMVARRQRPRTGRVLLVVAVAAVAVTGAGVVGGLVTRQPSGPDPALADLRAGQRDQADRLADIDARLDSAQRDEQVLAEVQAALAGSPVLTARLSGDAVIVTFPAGVFRAGDRLSDTGAPALTELATRLLPLDSDVAVTVTGHTEDAPVSGGRFRDNVDLGQARAQAAAAVLAQASGLPLSTFALASSGSANPPFPNTTAEERARNRTVTVTVRAR
jgi:flagellar motor protein MotB